MCYINADNANVFFCNALPDEVCRVLHGNYGARVATMTEEDLIKSTENLVVVARLKVQVQPNLHKKNLSSFIKLLT